MKNWQSRGAEAKFKYDLVLMKRTETYLLRRQRNEYESHMIIEIVTYFIIVGVRHPKLTTGKKTIIKKRFRNR